MSVETLILKFRTNALETRGALISEPLVSTVYMYMSLESKTPKTRTGMTSIHKRRLACELVGRI